MAQQLFVNNATTTLGTAALSTDTTLYLATGGGASFPSPTGGNWFNLTLTQAPGTTETSWEIVTVTARSTDTLTVTRAAEGSTAVGWAIGSTAELRITAAPLNAIAALAGAGGTNVVSMHETKTAPTVGTTTTLDCSTGNAFSLTGLSATTISTLTLSNVPAAGVFYGFILDLTYSGSGSSITWPAAVKWAAATAPTLTNVSGKRDSFALYTWDGGTSWIAAIVGQNL